MEICSVPKYSTQSQILDHLELKLLSSVISGSSVVLAENAAAPQSSLWCLQVIFMSCCGFQNQTVPLKSHSAIQLVVTYKDIDFLQHILTTVDGTGLQWLDKMTSKHEKQWTKKETFANEEPTVRFGRVSRSQQWNVLYASRHEREYTPRFVKWFSLVRHGLVGSWFSLILD